jgi:putative hydrolase of the HAD superfamily
MNAMTPNNCSAVIFDYGGVLCYAPTKDDVAEYGRESGLDEAAFLNLYAETRDYYGRAADGYEAHWHRVARKAGIDVPQKVVRGFIEKESGLWTRPNEEVLALAREIKRSGCRIAILSNMTFDLLRVLRTKFNWLDEFDVRVWSCEHGCAKPDETIYRTCVEQLGCDPGVALFFDDRACNVEGAKQAGINAHLFQSADQARSVVASHVGLP